MLKAVIFDWGCTLYDSATGMLFPETAQVVEHLAQTYTLAIVALITPTHTISCLAQLPEVLAGHGARIPDSGPGTGEHVARIVRGKYIDAADDRASWRECRR